MQWVDECFLNYYALNINLEVKTAKKNGSLQNFGKAHTKLEEIQEDE